MRTTLLVRWTLVVLLPLAGACQNTLKHKDWSTYDGPGKEHFLKEELIDEIRSIDDPIEPLNRGVSVFNHVLLKGIVAPVGWVYRTVLPKPVRNGVENVFDNLFYPVRLVNNLLQAKWGGAWNETKRFGVNTTVGVLGLWDRATDWGIRPSREDFGQTFGRWGWRRSSYIVIPVLGPATVRDGVGKIPDAMADPLTYYPDIFPRMTLYRSLTRLSNAMPLYNKFVETNYDPYTLGRRLFVLNRELRIDDYTYHAAAERTGETETLEMIFLGNKDPDFPGERKTHEVEIPSVDKELTYSIWLQPEPAPLIYFLPGTGGHRLGGSSTALAEIGYERGNSIVTISNAFNFEFIGGAASAAYPGFAPADAHDIHVAIDTIDEDIQKRYPGRLTDERRLVGISLGAMHTLFIAARAARPDNDLIDFDVFLSLNSPVNMRHAVTQLDAFFNAPMAFPKEDRLAEVRGILRKIAFLADGRLDPSDALPISKLEAEFLIGFSFRLTLGDVIYQTTLAHPMGVLQTERSFWKRTSAYQEIGRYSFMEYFYAWALPYYAELRDDISFTEEGADAMFAMCDLRSIEDELAALDNVLFVSNKNDFLLRPQDIEWAEKVFGENTLFFDRGGHLGNLHHEDLQIAVRSLYEKMKARNGADGQP